ncbi:MAG: hypothetical protein ABJ358_04975 [Rhizobiaceae bacterium]
MKKSKKSTTTNKVQTPRGQGHSARKAKPVTIDLKAEEVAKKKTASTPKVSAAAKSDSKPADAKQSPVAQSPKTETASAAKKEAPAPKSAFGRNGSSASKKETAAKPDTKKASSTSSKPTPPPSSPSSVPKKKSGDRMGRFAAALIGGCVALGGAGVLQYAGILESPGDSNALLQQQLATQSQAFTSQIDELKARLDGSEGNDTATLNSRIEEQVKQLIAQSAPTDGAAETDEIITQVNETTLRVEKLIADQKANADNINELQTTLAAGAPAASNSGDGGGGGGSSGAAVSALSLQVDNLASQATRIRADIKQIKSQLAGAIQNNTGSGQSVDPELTNRLTALENKIGDLGKMASSVETLRSDLASSSEQLGQQATTIAELKAAQDQPSRADKFAARSVAAAALKSDIDRGLPFSDSLKIFKNLSAGELYLRKLDDYASSGIPTSSQLAASFQSVGDAIVEATQPKPDDSLTSRLMAGVKSFVRVKARKPLEGSTPLAIVSQISEAVTTNDLSAASALWRTLPDAGQSVSADWHDQLQSRIIADELISSSVQSFLTSTATQ